MTKATISCEQFSEGLADLLERDADEATRARLEAHALSCSECGPLLADLRKLRIDAAALPVLVPQRDLWAGIAARIETPIVEIGPGNGRTVERSNLGTKRRRIAPLWMGLAAAGLVAVTATVTHQLTKRSALVATAAVASPEQNVVAHTPSVTAATPTTDSVPTFSRSTVPPSPALASNKTAAEQTYDAEINRLRTVVAQRRSVLDSATVTVIERNLKVIDDAIAQCREALLKDPASQFLMESLNGALDTKIQLLRTAATLPART